MINRKDMLGLIHQAAARAGLDDETYRDRLERLTGKRSARDCTDSELSLVLNNFHVKQRVQHPHHAKIKALFIAAYNLGCLDNGTDAALDTFVKRQTGKEHLGFVGPEEAFAVIEALKAIVGREGMVAGDLGTDGILPRCSLLTAQWAKLYRLKAVETDYPTALLHYVERIAGIRNAHICLYSARDLDACARHLGSWIRKVQNDAASRAQSNVA